MLSLERRIAWAFICSIACVLTAPAFAGPVKMRPISGRSDVRAEQNARRQILKIARDQRSVGVRKKIDAVLSDVTLYRRLPTQVVRCDPDLYRFMTTHPDVAVNIWKVLGRSAMNLVRTDRNKAIFRSDDGAGTKCDLQYLYSNHDTQLIYAVGSYNGPVFGSPIRGGCLLLLKTGYIREPDGRYYITVRLDAFVRIDHLAAGILTRTFRPLVNKAVDKNFRDSVAFLGNLSASAERKPALMQRLSEKLTKVHPQDRRRFAELAAQAAKKANRIRRRNAAHLGDASSVPSHNRDDRRPFLPARRTPR